jgi:hypothetical protein
MLRIKCNDALIKKVGTFIYLGREVNSERKIKGEINRSV